MIGVVALRVVPFDYVIISFTIMILLQMLNILNKIHYNKATFASWWIIYFIFISLAIYLSFTYFYRDNINAYAYLRPQTWYYSLLLLGISWVPFFLVQVIQYYFNPSEEQVAALESVSLAAQSQAGAGLGGGSMGRNLKGSQELGPNGYPRERPSFLGLESQTEYTEDERGGRNVDLSRETSFYSQQQSSGGVRQRQVSVSFSEVDPEN